MLRAAARTVNALGGQPCGTGNARRDAFQSRHCPRRCLPIVRLGLPGAAACAPMPSGCGLYFFAERPDRIEAWSRPKFECSPPSQLENVSRWDKSAAAVEARLGTGP